MAEVDDLYEKNFNAALRYYDAKHVENRAPSYCRVYDRLWIGDLASAVFIAVGGKCLHDPDSPRVPVPVRGVFNASDIEKFGASLELGYKNRDILYRTACDSETGVTLLDSEHMEAEGVIDTFLKHDCLQPTNAVAINDEACLVWSLGIPHNDYFVYTILSGVAKLAYLMEQTAAIDKNSAVLVHCMAGVNRSATILCAYLILKCYFTTSEAMSIVYGASKRKRDISSLSNETLSCILFDIEKHARLGIDTARENYHKLYDRIRDSLAQRRTVNIGSRMTTNTGELLTCHFCGTSLGFVVMCKKCHKVAYCSCACAAADGHKTGCRIDKEPSSREPAKTN